MSRILRTLLQYNRMHRRIRNQRKQLAALNKAINMWRNIAESPSKKAYRQEEP